MNKKLLAAILITVFGIGGVIANNIITTDHDHSVSANLSHSGGTDSKGCHHDHKKGGYHCH